MISTNDLPPPDFAKWLKNRGVQFPEMAFNVTQILMIETFTLDYALEVISVLRQATREKA